MKLVINELLAEFYADGWNYAKMAGHRQQFQLKSDLFKGKVDSVLIREDARKCRLWTNRKGTFWIGARDGGLLPSSCSKMG